MKKRLKISCSSCEKDFIFFVDDELFDMYHRWNNGDITNYDKWNFTSISKKQSNNFNKYSLIRHGKCHACREDYYTEIYGKGYLEECQMPSKFIKKNK